MSHHTARALDGQEATPVGVALLGATGSIGTSALRVLSRQRDRFVPVALTANANRAALAAQAAQFSPSYVGLVQECAGRPPNGGVGPTASSRRLRTLTRQS